MNYPSHRWFPWVATLSVCGVLLFSACEISSSDEVVRQVGLNIAGAYTNAGGIPANQTGNRVTLLSILQSGDRLQATDNQGGRWEGSIGRADANLATFTLNGATSAGQSVVLTGTLSVSGSTGTLSGTWIEPSLSAAASATATVAAPATATPTVSPTLTPTVTPTSTPVP